MLILFEQLCVEAFYAVWGFNRSYGFAFLLSDFFMKKELHFSKEKHSYCINNKKISLPPYLL